MTPAAAGLGPPTPLPAAVTPATVTPAAAGLGLPTPLPAAVTPAAAGLIPPTPLLAAVTPAAAGLGPPTSRLTGDTPRTPTVHPDRPQWSFTLHPIRVSPFLEDVGPTFTVPSSPSEVFSHFLTDSICETIVTQTNLYAKQVMGEDRYELWEKVTVKELRAYFGLRILMGAVKLPAIPMYWNTDPALNQPEITSRISRNRFQDLSRYLHFADNSDLPVRGEPGHDRLGKVQPMIDAFQERFIANYMPNREQAVDEAMIPFQGRSSLKQYLPAKPVKRGIKVWCRADSHNGYLCEF